MSEQRRIRVRAGLAIVREAKILLVAHHYDDKPTQWVLLGGGVDFGETLP